MAQGFAMTEALITVGVPTFERAECVRSLLDQIENSEGLREHCRVLVIDDASRDGTATLFAQPRWPKLGHRLKYIRNETNLGYPKNFMRLFAECETEYLLVMADDDLLVEAGFAQTLGFLGEQRPTLVSPQWLQHGKVFRGTTSTRPIEQSEFMACSGHAPGLVYRVDHCREHLRNVEARIMDRCAFTTIYPQVTLCLQLLLHDQPAWFLPFPVAEEGNALPSGIKDPSGEHYAGYRSRLRQAAALDQLIASTAPPQLKDEIASVASLFYLRRILDTAAPEVRRAFLMAELLAAAREHVLGRMLAPIRRPLRAIRNGVMPRRR
jgi:hypothetical protein